MGRIVGLAAMLALSACAGSPTDECLDTEQFDVWVDGDGDGYGAGAPERACVLADGFADNALDCDDADDAVHPEASEVCNGRDDDCDGSLDDGFPARTWYTDADGDGYGVLYPAQVACEPPGAGWVANTDDCDDDDDGVFPGAAEVCNGGVDDDCNGLADDADPTIDEDTQYRGWRDFDLDGYGDPDSLTRSCEFPVGLVENDEDCDDTRAEANPDGSEVCNGRDDDCDTLIDDDDPTVDPTTQETFWADEDGDGFGNPDLEVLACSEQPGIAADNPDDCDDTRAGVSPDRPELLCDAVDNDCDLTTTDDVDADGDGYMRCVDDCDDTRAEVNPEGSEVCNGRDDDCDVLVDDDDPSLDSTTQQVVWADADGDGFGDPAVSFLACREEPGVSADNPDDCDDTRGGVSPARPELLCDATDNDCDPATTDDVDADGDGYMRCVDDCDDTRADVNPAAVESPDDGVDQNCNDLEGCFEDADGDGARTDTFIEVADPQCNDPGNAPIDWPVDCDDADPTVNIIVDWVEDLDGDGWGAGPVVVASCLVPGPDLVPATVDEDCDDTDDTINPGAPDVCYDGTDGNCDGRDTCATCFDWLASDPASIDGVYPLELVAGVFTDVWCDMTTDGGGWTLVGSTEGQTMDDAAGNWHADLTTLFPAGPHTNVWSGMRPYVVGAHDLRFACKLDPADPVMEVDLSFHGVPWYTIITTGTELQSCFNELDGQGQTPATPPERINNLTGQMRPQGDQWNYGYLEGEDSCGDNGDFTVDFDDRGMDSNQSDGTDWGEDDSSMKCGSSYPQNGAWFIFVRE